jgi:hypothetical protein
MFTPEIDLEVWTKSTVLRFTDTTGVDTGAGTKWDGVAGLDSSLVSAAYLTITDPDSDVLIVNVTATIAAASPVTGDILFADQTGEWVDGYYTVVYDVHMQATAITAFADYSGTVAGTVRVTSALHLVQTGMKVTIAGTTNYNGTYDATLINANQYYITATWVADDAAGTSTPYYSDTFLPFVYSNAEIGIEKMYAIFAEMDESTEADDYLKQVELANGLLNAIKSAIATTTAARVNNIYGRITRILDYNSIDLIYE